MNNKYFLKMIEEYGFEYREVQEKMSEIISNIFDYENSCFIEAGTGVGKSLAYLIPAVIKAKENNTRVVISTNTINLQEQLIEKDIPFLEEVMGEEIRHCIVKGRSNYICGNRLMKNCDDEQIIEWYKKTKTGDKSEIKFYLDPEMWAKICGDKDFCVTAKCAQTNRCFFYNNRKKMENSDLLVVNHSILFSNYKYDKILPNFKYLVIDEAHNIENIARMYLESSISSKEVYLVLGLMYNRKSKNGILKKLVEAMINETENKEIIDNLFLDTSSALDTLYDEFVKFFTDISKRVYEKNVMSMKISDLKYTSEILDRYSKFTDLKNEIIELSKALYIDEKVIDDFIIYSKKIDEFINCIREIIKNDDNKVNWVKVNNQNLEVSLHSTPINISDIFYDIIKDKSAILTSATLRINNSFDYIKKRLGLVDLDSYFLESPFDYNKNMTLYLSNNPYDPNGIEYMDYCVKFINHYLNNKTEGSFILCTSYKQVEYISKQIKLEGYNILVQGEMSRTNLIKEFKKKASILIGTDSFWEGVDVKGEKLKNVIIIKIPFQVPAEPITEAIIENIRKNGGNPFMEYQLPNSIVKLRQGVGRLIRSKEDKGSVIILDNRLRTKRYGNVIVNSMPTKTVKKID